MLTQEEIEKIADATARKGVVIPQVLDAKDSATYLGIGSSSFNKIKDRIPATILVDKPMFWVKELDKYIESRTAYGLLKDKKQKTTLKGACG